MVSRALLFDIVVGTIAALVLAKSDGITRGFALSVLILCEAWLPWDLVTERRRSS